jgi:anti-sigma B factor antagonist
MGLHIGVDSWGRGVSLVHLAGDVDVYTSPALQKVLIDLDGQGFRALLVDLNDVNFIHATGMGVVVGAVKRARVRGGSVDLICLQERFLELFELANLTAVFRIYATQDDARAYSGLV